MSADPLPYRLMRLRPWTIALLLVGLAIAGWGATKLRFDFAPQRIFESDDPAYAELREVTETFGREDNLFLVHVKADDVFTPEVIGYVRTLHAALAKVESVQRVDDLTSAAWVPRPLLGPGPLLKPGELSEADLAVAKQAALASPMIRGRLVGKQGRGTLLAVRLDPDRTLFEQLRPPVHACMKVLESTPRPAGVETLSTGIPVARVLIVERLVTDQLTFLPIVSGMFVFILWLVFRDLRAVIVPLLAVLISLIALTGLLGLTGEPVNIINNVLPVLVFVIGISDAIHLLVRYRREISEGVEQQTALAVTIRHLVVACLLTSVTTAIGFGTLVVAKISILQRFGIYAAAGVLIAYVITVTFVPLVFSFLSPEMKETGKRADAFIEELSAKLGRLTLRFKRPILILCVVMVGGCITLAARVEVQNNIYETFSDDDPVVEANRRIEADFGGIVPISVVVRWKEGTQPLDPKVLAYVAEWQARLSQEGYMCVSLVDLLSEVSANFTGKRALPPTREGCAQALRFLEGGLKTQGRSDDLSRLWRPDKRVMRVAAFAPDQGSRQMNAVFERLEALVEGEAARQQALGVEIRLSGDGPVASRGVDDLISDLFYSLLLAFLVILPTMCLLLRSVWAGLVSMIPNITPLLLTLGMMGAVGMDLRVTTVIVFSISLGLAVDDTIHFMVRFREEWRRERPTPNDKAALEAAYAAALERTFRGTGGAIVTTTLLLSCGFGALLLSNFPVSRNFALLMEVTVIAALVGDLILLPACIAVLKPFKPVANPVGPPPGPTRGDDEGSDRVASL